VLARLVKLVLDLVPGAVIDRTRRIPLLASVLRRGLGVVSGPLHGRVVPIAHGPAKGLLLVFDETSAVWASGKTEASLQRALERLLEPGSVFIDIGANVGFFTLLGARLVGPSGKVIAFEPHAENVQRLRRNVELNAFSNVEVIVKAVSDASGHRFLDARHPATAALLPANHSRPGDGLACVEATSLDDFLATRPDLDPDVLKIDAEGHEVEIVRGMLTLLRRRDVVLLCEMHGRDREFATALDTVEYVASSVPGSSRLQHVIAAPRRTSVLEDDVAGPSDAGGET
jgi:FkbM family methyltransferase